MLFRSVISASPRRGGNSDLLCDEFVKGAVSAGHDVQKIFVKDKKIGYCTGCGFCNKNNHSGCSQKDDMAEVLEQMIEADVIVLSTPVYFYTMCAQLKTLIDRCCAKYTKIQNKEFYFIMAAADSSNVTFKSVVEEFRAFLYCLSGVSEKGVLEADGVWQLGDVKSTKHMARAFEMGCGV